MNFNLSEEQMRLKEFWEKFTDDNIIPRAEEIDRTGEFPYDLMGKVADNGFIGIIFPSEYGGSNGDTVSLALSMEEIGRGDMSLGITLCASFILPSLLIYNYGTAEQKKYWLKPIIKGKQMGGFGLTETAAGSDARGLKTTACLDKNEWIINGEKNFITNAGLDYDGMIIIGAVTGKRADGENEISSFIVPKGSPGYVIGEKYSKLGWRGTDTRRIFFKDCRIPKENLLGERGKGLKQLLEGLNTIRIVVAAISIGQSRSCYNLALSYAKKRKQFNQPISQFQLLQQKLANMSMDIEMSRLLIYKSAWQRDNNQDFSLTSAMAKLFASEVCKRCADEAIQIHGAYGILDKNPLTRYWRNVKMGEISTGTSEILRTIIARKLGC